MDVVKEAIDEGAAGNFQSAPTGCTTTVTIAHSTPRASVDILIPELGVEFDFILAYSVFTHIARKEMHDLVGQLRFAPSHAVGNAGFHLHRPSSLELAGNLARQQPAMAIGIGPWNRNLRRCRWPSRDMPRRWRLKVQPWCRREPNSMSESDGIDWRANAHKSSPVLLTAEFLQQEFPDAKILPPVRGEMQGCCLLRRAASAP